MATRNDRGTALYVACAALCRLAGKASTIARYLTGKHACVDAQGDGHIAVTEAARYEVRGKPLSKQYRGVRVTQIVESDAGKPKGLHVVPEGA